MFTFGKPVLNVGIYSSVSLLQEAKPASSNINNSAWVGVSAPYTVYLSDGVAWNKVTVSDEPALSPVRSSITSNTTVDSSTTAIGTFGMNLSPAFVRSIGASTAVAAAMEALSAAMPKNSRWNDPRVTEQGVIELAPNLYTLEKGVLIDISTASTSRYGLTIRGQGPETTRLYAPPTASAAGFKDIYGDGIWRMFKVSSSLNNTVDSVRLEGFGLVQYFTQGGDGASRLTDPCRTLEMNYVNNSRLEDLGVYIRSLNALSRDQRAYYIRRNYYGGMQNCRAFGFRVTSATFTASLSGTTMTVTAVSSGAIPIYDLLNGLGVSNGTFVLSQVSGTAGGVGVYSVSTSQTVASKSMFTSPVANTSGHAGVRRGGVGYYFEENNAYTASKILSTGFDSAAIADFEDGLSIFGLDIEHSNKGLTFINTCLNNEIRGVRNEMHVLETGGAAVENLSEMWLSKFSTTSRDNTIQMSAGPNNPNISSIIDLSDDKSNRVISNQLNYRQITTPIVTTPAVSGLTVSTNSTDIPPNSSVSSVTEITWSGVYNHNRSWTFTVDPRIGSVTIRMDIRRVSGDGMMVPRIETVDNMPIYYALLIDRFQRYQAVGLYSTVFVALTGNSWSSGFLTLKTTRAHLLQAGMRLQVGTGIGSLAAGTNLYIAEVVGDYSFKVALVSDPGAISQGATLTIPFDMQNWLGQPDVTSNWREINVPIKVRTSVKGMSLDVNSKPVLTLDMTGVNYGLTTGVQLALHGFVDSRLNTDYTVLAGDVSGSTLTLTGLSAMSDLVTSGASVALDGDTIPGYGYVGIKTLRVTMRGVTTSGTTCIWRCTDPVIVRGTHREMITS